LSRVSLAEVARVAGVGKATASRALSPRDHPDIAPETRQHVRAVAEQLGYRPSRTAQALRTGRHRILSLVIPLQDWAWWAPMLQGAAEETRRRGYNLLVHPLQPADGIGAVVQELKELAVDGLIMVTPDDSLDDSLHENRWDLKGLNMPVLYIDDTRDRPDDLRVCAANRSGGVLVGRHLLARERKQPLIIEPAGDFLYVRDRRQGFIDAFLEEGIVLTPDRFIVSGETYAQEQALLPALQQRIQEGVQFDAVFATSDYLAISALRSLRQAGIRVPQDVSVVGFDDERAALLVDPRLTTVRQPLHQMGETAVQLLLDAVTAGEARSAVHELDVELVFRESS